MILIKTMKQKHVESTIKKGAFCFNTPSTFIYGSGLASAQQDKWDSHLSFDAFHIMVAPILFEDENGPHYGPAEKFADSAKMHTISSLSKSTPLCSFREMTNEEAVFKYGALFLRLGDTVDRIKKDFGHDAFILIRDANALMARIYEKTPCCGRKVHYGEINAEFQKYIDKVGYSQAAMFQKSLEYAWQQEFRIIIAPQENKDRVFVEVGSIEDIAIGGDIEALRNGFFIGKDDNHVNEVLHTLKESQITMDDIFKSDPRRLKPNTSSAPQFDI